MFAIHSYSCIYVLGVGDVLSPVSCFFLVCHIITSTQIIGYPQGEAFVPESIVRLGTRVDGRDGVQTLTTGDHRIKSGSFS